MPTFPTLYISTLHAHEPSPATDGLTTTAIADLAEELADADVHSPPATSLVCGSVLAPDEGPRALLCLGDPSRRALAHWCRLAWSTYASLVCVSIDDMGRDDTIGPRDIPLLTGHGIIVASRGITGAPMAGMRVDTLRRELRESRQQLSEAVGYPVRWLAPTPTIFGTAVDGLVLEEARRAGYRRVLHPGSGIIELDDDPIAAQFNGCARLPYRTVQTDDSPASLVKWVVGERFTRSAARLKQLARTPRRLLDRFKKT